MRYRERAEALRSIADVEFRREARRILVSAAEDYERMARELDSRDNTDGQSGSNNSPKL
jgi:hypothetical protein